MDQDKYELMASDLEVRQIKRYDKAKKNYNFWTPLELSIFETIKTMRQQSTTYHPFNER